MDDVARVRIADILFLDVGRRYANLYDCSLGDVINKWRGSMGLEEVHFSEGPLLAETLKVPFTYCWSPSLVSKPKDWGPHIGKCFAKEAIQGLSTKANYMTQMSVASFSVRHRSTNPSQIWMRSCEMVTYQSISALAVS